MIRRAGSGYEVLSESGKNLGREPTKGAAERRLSQVEHFKHEALSDEHSKQRIRDLEGQLDTHRAALAGMAAGRGAGAASRLAGNGGQSRGIRQPTPERRAVPGVDFPSAQQVEYAAGYDPAELSTRASALDYPATRAPDATALDDAFRRPRQYSYEYKDPTIQGAAPGTHVGPMAHELEDIPGVVSTGPDGLKRVDTGRLGLATASQTAKHRRELDELKQKVDALSDAGDAEGVLRAAAGR